MKNMGHMTYDKIWDQVINEGGGRKQLDFRYISYADYIEFTDGLHMNLRERKDLNLFPRGLRNLKKENIIKIRKTTGRLGLRHSMFEMLLGQLKGDVNQMVQFISLNFKGKNLA